MLQHEKQHKQKIMNNNATHDAHTVNFTSWGKVSPEITLIKALE
jgi:hypothetical protein